MAVLALGCLCNVGGAVAEDRLLASNPQHVTYRRVRWAMLLGIW